MIRRMFLQMITGTSAGVVVPRINPPKAIKNHPAVEGGVEPLPSFPLMGVTRITNGDEDHTVYMFPNRSTLNVYVTAAGGQPITDDILKNLVYRNATIQLSPYAGTPVEMKLTLDLRIIINNNGTTTFSQQKGQSGENLVVTF